MVLLGIPSGEVPGADTGVFHVACMEGKGQEG